jgi:hypothetical protein
MASYGEEWDSAIDLARDWYVRQYGDRLHSLYIRGSVASGYVHAARADLDLIGLVTHSEFIDSYRVWEHVAWEGEFAVALHGATGLRVKPDFAVASLNKGFLERSNGLPALLATQCACLYGKDIIPWLPRCRPGPDVMYYNGRLKLFLAMFYDRIVNAGGRQGEIAESKRVLKAIIRCAGELGLERHGCYTRDLFFCCLNFEKEHPAQGMRLWRALDLYLDPSPALGPVMECSASIGHWVAARERSVDLTPRPGRLARILHDLGLSRSGFLRNDAYARS